MRRGALVAFVLAIACGDRGPPGAVSAASWHTVLSGLDATLLCVWGTGPTDVFAVGGPLGDGTPSAILHYDGSAWRDLNPGGTETLWWVHGTGSHDVWAVGEKGRIVHYDGAQVADRTFTTDATLYGVWAAASDDVWAVGGTPSAGTGATNDFVLHFDGASWSPVVLPQKLGRAMFKVWGAARDDLYVVGEAGTIWHRAGTTWTLESNPPLASGTLFTVNGCSAGDIYAVGGRDVLHSDGTHWTRLDPMLTNDANGVACAAPQHAVVVGFGGLKQRLVGDTWHDDFDQDPHQDLHGAWADATGAYWAAGGDFVSPPHAGAARAGLLAYFGASPPSGARAH